MSIEEQARFFFRNVSIFEIEKFCLEAGYCVVIESPDNFWIEKEYGL